MTVQMKRRLAVARKAVEASQVREEIERSCYPADEQR
jgi:hypothetical protein